MRLRLFALVIFISLVAAPRAPVSAQELGGYEGRAIAGIDVSLEGSAPDAAAESEFRSIIQRAMGSEFAAVRERKALQDLFDTQRVASARVEVSDANGSIASNAQRPIRVRFTIRRQVIVGAVRIDLGVTTGLPVSTDELRARLNMLEPGSRVSDQTLRRNADEIQTYLRDRGFFNSEVPFSQQLDASGTRSTVTFNIKLGEQARVDAFNINVTGFDQSRLQPLLKLQPGTPFTRQALGEDVNRIRQAIIATDYLAPTLDDARVERDPQTNKITITLKGAIGPKVSVSIKGYDELKEKKARELLPVKREGNIDFSAIVEGERRIRNRLQEDGYFFAELNHVCTVTPPSANTVSNGTPETCESLNPEDLTGRAVNITYEVERGRRFKLTDIRIAGTNKLAYEDVADDLKSQKANALGFIPLLGYGRGYTSRELLEQDRRTVEARMKDIGYRRAHAVVRQGVTLNGESLVITFAVEEGPLTRVAGVEIRGNQIYTEGQLRKELKTAVVEAPYSRSLARADGDRILNLYASDGYVDAQLDFSIVELPKRTVGDTEEERVRLVYTIRNEGDKVFINDIIVNGLVGNDKTKQTKRDAIVGATTLVEGDVLRADRLTESERALYATDAFRQVIITTRPAGETASGFKKRDIVIDVEELKPRILSYGGGFSTDNGPLGFVDLRNVNLFGKLRQGGARIRASRNQQLIRLEYFDPRFQRYGNRQYAPLSFSVQYQRDSTITRFFRSTIDRGSFGIVQRLDKDGNPIDEFGNSIKEPTINRFTVNLETQRVLQEKTRSIVFVRYSYEDVRLFNLGSLLIADILRPDKAVRLSRFGASFVRDTRELCSDERSLTSLATAQEPCHYSQFDATRGDFLTVDYSIALRQLGGNLSFNKFQATYRRYYQLKSFRKTVFALNSTLGLANLFNPRDRDGNNVIDETDLTLPISERFFSGGSTTLRGFGFEEAGPRQVETPVGKFRNQKGEEIFLNPFTIPVGGNALAVLNLEARVPVTKVLQVVPFYDGGNVFRKIGDLFDKNSKPGDDPNLRAHWTHTVGMGLRIKTPFAGALAVDYGFLLNPPQFILRPATPMDPEPSIYRLKRSQIHFRFTQAF
ncbi:MAG: POTRA domain-containing protein [Pyrinomonadaceae bacterium]